MNSSCDDQRLLFWRGFGLDEPLSYKNLKILEIGCGRGKRCFEAALGGASKVLGVDIAEKSIQHARTTLSSKFPEFISIVTFECSSINQISENNFDVIISENAFEHILDVPSVLNELKLRLKKGGKIYIGFGPLFHSPFGDHGWIRGALPFGRWLPWSHTILPRGLILKILSRYHRRQITNFCDWPFQSLNELTVADFRRIFEESGLRVLSFRVNVGYSPTAKLFALIGKFPPLEKYFTHNVFCILEKEV
mgnify:CR=1 FL=1